VSLDESDDDPIVLLAEIATAIDRIVPIDPGVFRGLLGAAGTVSAEVLPRLLNSLHDAPELTLLLDDSHRVRAKSSADTLASLCEHLPPRVRLILAARELSSVPLARLGARGRLFILGPADLRLTASEAQGMLNSMHVSLDNEAFDLAYERTEGWAAGVYFAGLRALECPDAKRAVQAVGGDDRIVFDYLSSELVKHVPFELRSFLQRTSVLGRFSASLCDAVLERADSATLLADLEESNGFLVPLDNHRGWYRYHRLLGEMLRADLARVEPGIGSSLHARASQWHELHGNISDAIEHAIAGHAGQRAADLLAKHIRVLFNSQSQLTIQRWLKTLSEFDLTDCPAVAAGAAWVAALLGERAETDRYISILEHSSICGTAPFGEGSAQLAAARLKASLAWEGVSRMRQLAELAYQSEPPGSPARSRAAASVGANLWLRGRAAQACAVLDEAATLGESGADTAIVALGLLGLIHLEGREVNAAAARIREGFTLVNRCDQLDSLAASGLLVARAWLSVESGDHASANSDLMRAAAMLPLAGAMPWWSISLGVFCSKVARALGDLDQADSFLAQARRELARYPDAGVLPHLLSGEERAVASAHEHHSIPCEPLTESELRVLELAPTHLTQAQIARDRCISRNTVKTHFKAIYGKLNVSSRADAVARAQAIGLLRRSLSSA
jgi:LuxR family maltose regulon positive regulatory protein